MFKMRPTSPLPVATVFAIWGVVVCSCVPRTSPGSLDACTTLSPDEAVRAVQQSQAFQTALRADAGRWGEASMPPSGVVERYCAAITETEAVAIGSVMIRLYHITAPEAAEPVQVRFAVPSGSVVLLNPIRERLEPGLDIRQWNSLVRQLTRSMGAPDTTVARRYGCQVLALANNAYPGGPCTGDRSIGAQQPNGAHLITLPRLGWSVTIASDWTIDRIDMSR